MRNFKLSKILFLIILIFIIVLLFIISRLYYEKHCLGNKYISNESIEQIKNTHTEYTEKINLYFAGRIIPYSYYGNFYLLNIKNSNDYKKVYTNSDFKIRIINKENDSSIKLFIYNDKYYKQENLELTNLPVISITNDKLNLYGFSINDELKCNFSLRGSSSKLSDKQGYKLNLYTQTDNKIKRPLLGMINSNSWILNPIFFDNSYMREKIGYDIWNNLSNNFQHKLEYVELIINNNYQGLYYLTEKVTLDTFNGNSQNDLLISTKNWKKIDEGLKLFENNGFEGSLTDEFEFDDGLEDNYQEQFRILNLFNLSLFGKDEKEEIKYDLDNMVNYSLFINLVMAVDNTYKNQKIIFKKVNSHYLVQKTIWDLDWTFNNENIYKYNTDFKLTTNDIIYDMAIPDNLSDSKNYINLSKKKYLEIKKKYFNENNIFKLIDKYSKYLESYGAVNRDMKKWNNSNYKESINRIKKFIKDRIRVLDEYYGGL